MSDALARRQRFTVVVEAVFLLLTCSVSGWFWVHCESGVSSGTHANHAGALFAGSLSCDMHSLQTKKRLSMQGVVTGYSRCGHGNCRAHYAHDADNGHYTRRNIFEGQVMSIMPNKHKNVQPTGIIMSHISARQKCIVGGCRLGRQRQYKQQREMRSR